MVASDTVLELRNIFHSGQVEPTGWLQKLFGTVETGLILKDVSLEVKAGEVLAILGSKGSGKRALLDVISRRAHGPTRGQISLEGVPLTPSIFQKRCSYVTHRADLIPWLSVRQTLAYAAKLSCADKVSRYSVSARVRQMLADLALTQVCHHLVSALTPSQYRRLVIGTHLIKEPVVLLLDEPTSGLDPLSTYLIVSMLSSYARRRGRCVVVTMEKPRSDVFPFLDRAAFLCLGDVLYAGPTRLLLGYFSSIGFPSPAVENPLMYYLCLSTVDRRSRERFLESNAQILELVDKFKAEGGAYLGTSAGVLPPPKQPPFASEVRRPSSFSVAFALYQRLFASTFNVSLNAMYHLFLRLAIFPLYAFIVFLLYFNTGNPQHAETDKYGLLFYSIFGAYFCSIVSAAYTFSSFRTRYYQEAQEGLYGGPVFLLTYYLFSLPFSFITVAAASRILFQTTGLDWGSGWAAAGATLWGCYLLAEYCTLALMMVIRSPATAALSALHIAVLLIIASSGALRSYGGLPEWLLYLSYGTQGHYAAAALSQTLFGPEALECSQGPCRFADNARHFAHASTPISVDISLAFPGMAAIADILLYLMPLPTFVKAKFRE